MNEFDSCLERLFRAASRVRPALPAEAPYGLETRLLNAWRGGLKPEGLMPLLPVVQRAFLCACAILVITAALALHSLRQAPPPPANELVTVDSSIQLTLMQ
jgi:hypothetical protein